MLPLRCVIVSYCMWNTVYSLYIIIFYLQKMTERAPLVLCYTSGEKDYHPVRDWVGLRMSCHFCRTQSVSGLPLLLRHGSPCSSMRHLCLHSNGITSTLRRFRIAFCLLSHSPSKLGICLQRETNHMLGASPVLLVFYSSTRNLFWIFVSQKHPAAKGQTCTVMCLLHLE